MADVSALEQPETKGETPTPASPTQKRKRMSDVPSPESRRSKRGTGAPTVNMGPADSNEIAQAFLHSALESAQATAVDNMSAADFSALQQATVDHPDVSDPANASTTAAAALGSMYPTLHVPPSTEETFAAQIDAEQHEAPFHAADGLPAIDPAMDSPMEDAQPGVNGVKPENRLSAGPKPAVGSEEWHKLRKDNHKEVERRRRETINEGINELAKIVPGCEKNKGSILARSVAFITQLKENETQNIEKWTLEKLLTEQAISELSQSNDKLKTECERLYRELEAWKRVAQSAGLSPDTKEGS